jgi:cell fate regulator YaaT (PSP1 superfamily)
MPQHLIEVAFRGNRKEFFLWDGETPPPLRRGVIVEADRGEDLGHVHASGELAERRSRGVPHGLLDGATPKKAIRLATADDEKRILELVDQGEQARRRAMERVKANALVMKLSDAEWQWDRKKLTFYFTAEKRVDFRALVRDLAAMFRTRIELKQIGVRDEAKRLDGIGRCGRQYCSASWLPELRPVNLGVAKDQRLSLNPTQISGACGRLMCCLRYEHDFYVQSRKRFPKEGKILVTSRGEEKVISSDIFNERVTLRTAEGESRVVPLAELREELAAVGLEQGDGGAATAIEQLPPDDEAPPARPPRRTAPTSRPDPMRALPVVNAPAPSIAREAARLLEQVAPVDATTSGEDTGDDADELEAGVTPAPVGAVVEEGEAGAASGPGGGPAEGDDIARRPRRRRGRRGGRRGRGAERPDGSRPDATSGDGGGDADDGDGDAPSE